MGENLGCHDGNGILAPRIPLPFVAPACDLTQYVSKCGELTKVDNCVSPETTIGRLLIFQQ
jgi:hypothetical protein